MTVLRAWTVRLVTLLVCLIGVAVSRSEAAFDVGTNVLVTLTTNQTRYVPGDRFELGRTLNVVRGTAQAQGDLYVRVQDPAGQLLYFGGSQFNQTSYAGGGSIRSATGRAFRSDPWPLDLVLGLSGPFFVRDTILAGTIPFGLLPGTYTFDATFVRPGGDPRDPSAVITTSIPIGVSVGTPSRVANSAIRVTSSIVGMAVNPRTNTVAVARDPGILSLVNLTTERPVFSTPVLDPEDAVLARGLNWGGSLGAVAVDPVTNIAVVTNAQPVYAPGGSFTPYVWLVDLSTGRLFRRFELDPSPAITDPTSGEPLSFLTLNNRILVVRPAAINSRTSTVVVSSVAQANPEQTRLRFIDLSTATLDDRYVFVGPRINSIAIDEVRNRLIGIRSPRSPNDGQLFILDLRDRSPRFMGFPANLASFKGASRTLAILPDTGEVVVTGAVQKPDGSFVGAVTAIDVDRGRATTPVEVPNTPSVQDPVLLPNTRLVLVNGLAAGLSRLALVDLDRGRADEVFQTSISFPTATLSPASDALLLGGDAENLYVLRPGGTPPPRPVGGLRVRVLNGANGAAIDGATVVVDGVGLAGLTALGGPLDFPAVPPGSQTVIVSAAGFTPLTLPVAIDSGRSQEITASLQPGGAQALFRGRVLVEAGTTQATMRVAPDRTAISRQALIGQPGVTIRIPGTNLQVTSGPDGTFRIEQAPVGTFLVNTSAQGFQETQEIVTIRNEADNRLILTLLRTLGG